MLLEIVGALSFAIALFLLTVDILTVPLIFGVDLTHHLHSLSTGRAIWAAVKAVALTALFCVAGVSAFRVAARKYSIP